MPLTLVSDETSLLSLQTAPSHYILVWHFLCACMQRERESSVISSSPWIDTRPVDEGPTFMTSFTLTYLMKAPSLNTITLQGRASTYEF